MKKMLFGLSLALAALGFLGPPAMAADPPQAAPVPSAADLAFLASLATPPAPPAPAAKRPTSREKALCSATARCWDGTTRYCDSNNSATTCTAVDSNCPYQQGYVTCDGSTSWCPPCPGDCCDAARDACASSCYPCGYSFSCDASTCEDTCRCRFATCPP